ncbi:GNAT family N-acetyltransferase [Caulobacter sp. Root1472]|uniref:GNAT family N-acetyltransferase n=1 Tax=Caulobacter sp. Root1472 TaxID=1736470 RepID=UPI000700315E|nr:GNAT family N-acetyltransferase [Caulobacter sp. Root1472]KQZ27244.1 GCN5 family acetyltransferase [Caulobacter sp. Root1472]
MPVTTQVSVRPAVAADGDLILQFIRDLAAYEKLLDDVRATRDDITVALFGDNPKAFCDIAEIDGRPVGFALWFYNFSTFVGRHGIYLEDLFVQPQARGSGAGRALLANLAKRCVDENLGRLEWAVLDWNAPSIAFYDSLGAAAMDEWIVRRMTGEALRKLAGV